MGALSTEWSRSIGIDVPIVNAPMGGVAGGALAAAVCRAGGLGMIGMGSAGTAERLAVELRHVSKLDRPFGIGLVDWVAASQPDLLTTALAAAPCAAVRQLRRDLGLGAARTRCGRDRRDPGE